MNLKQFAMRKTVKAERKTFWKDHAGSWRYPASAACTACPDG